MSYTSSGVVDFRMSEVSPYLFGVVLRTPQVAPQVFLHLRLVARTPPAQGVGLHVLIEQFVRVQVRAVAREEKEMNLLPVACHPSLQMFGHMHRMFVDDEKDLASGMPDEPSQEHNTNLSVE